MLFGYFMSHIICLDLWLSGKRFKGPPKDLKNGNPDLPLWTIIPGFHLITMWLDCVKVVPLLREALLLEVQMLQAKDEHHYFTDCAHDREKHLREVQMSIQKMNYRSQSAKGFAILYESSIGLILQGHITLNQAGSLNDVIIFLKKDFENNGAFGSIASSMLSSYLSIFTGV